MIESNEVTNQIFYKELLKAWFTTRFEKDRQLIKLSVSCLLFLTWLSTIIEITNEVLLHFAFLCFVVVIISILLILEMNANHIEQVLQGKTEKSLILTILDKIAPITFIIGIISIILIGLN